jgi:glyoxylase-like metal-dependent hydrolase (beta-lactamase superfamily II)
VITAAATNSAATDSIGAVPDSIASRAQRPAPTPPPIAVTLAELAPGVWRAEGGSHHSLVVEHANQLVVVEAPQSRARSRAVLDTLRARFPRKPVGMVVNTHHHWDHAGGLREYMAANVAVATHRRNVDFVREIARAPKRLAPDALSRTPRLPTVRSVEDSLTIGSGETQVVLHRLPSVHAEGILAAYLPAHRLLFVADVLSPGPTLPPQGSREVVAMVRERGLAVDRVVGAHGGVAAWADVEGAAR